MAMNGLAPPPTARGTSSRVLMSDRPGGSFKPFVNDVDVRLSSQGSPWDDALVLEVDDVPPAEMVDCFPQSPTLVLHLDGAGGTVERMGSHRRFERFPTVVGALDFDPVGEPTAVRWTEPHKLLCLMPSQATLQRAMAEMPGAQQVELVRANHVRDPQIERIGHALMAECESGFASGRMFGESMALALASRLLSQFGTREIRWEPRGEGGLPLWRLRQVKQYLEENLSSDLRLADLAAVAQMSEFHFSRLFKQSTGMPPYRYILERRVQRGCELLASGSMPLHEVAASLGFSDQSHFTTIFKRSTGQTPKQFRDQARR